MPRSDPTTKPSAMSLRGLIALRPGVSLGLRLRSGLGRSPQGALEVVEDEPGRRLGRGRRGNHRRAVLDDEQASVRGRRLDLGQLAFGDLAGLLDQCLRAL